MSEGTLRAVVVGAGFAGEGHTLALRDAGVEVVAICARTAEVVQAVAARLGVPEASTDWQQTLQQVRPEIVAVATPGSLRAPVIEAAAGLGAHLYCDKPLAPDGPRGGAPLPPGTGAGVKHALAATHRYDPSVEWLAELVREGTIGPLLEVEGTFRRRIDPLTPWTWYDHRGQRRGLDAQRLPALAGDPDHHRRGPAPAGHGRVPRPAPPRPGGAPPARLPPARGADADGRRGRRAGVAPLRRGQRLLRPAALQGGAPGQPGRRCR